MQRTDQHAETCQPFFRGLGSILQQPGLRFQRPVHFAEFGDKLQNIGVLPIHLLQAAARFVEIQNAFRTHDQPHANHCWRAAVTCITAWRLCVSCAARAAIRRWSILLGRVRAATASFTRRISRS